MNQLGDAGWELAAALEGAKLANDDTFVHLFYFKRPGQSAGTTGFEYHPT